MLEAFSKFVDVLKASGWQTGFVTLFAAAFVYLSHIGVLPPMEPWMVLAGLAVAFAFGALATASLVTAIQNGLKATWSWWQRRQAQEAAVKRFVDDIPTLTEHERRILGYLRHHKIRAFDTDIDGGYANTLLAKCYLYHAAGTQQVDPGRVPTLVADYVWRIVNARADNFPHQPEWGEGGQRRGVETLPWRIPWNLR